MALSATDHNTNNSCSASDDLWDNLASDTTDDEQEELPYDGIHECYLIPNTDCNEVRSSEEHLDQLELNRGIYIETDSKSDKNEASCEIEEIDVFSFSEKVSKCSSEYEEETLQSFNHEGQSKVLTTIIPDVLLRHFNDDNLLSQCQFIDHETIPEISIAESSDEILISKMSCTKQSQDGSEPEQEDDLGKLVLVTDGNDNQESNLNSDRNSDVDNALSLVNCEKENPKLIEECTGQEDPLHDCFDKENPYHIYGIQRRLSSNDIKYGQGQVHYKLPDFSKVPPKVKIPKGNGNIKPMPIMKRARSSPNLTGPSVLIKDILDSMQPLVEPEPSHTSELLHVQVQEVQTEVLPHGHQAESDVYETSSVFSEELEVSKNIASPKGPTEGEKMSEVLKEQALQLKAKVESFSDCLIKGTLSVKEQQLIFQNLKLCLESLELNYLSTKEQHRDLQLQMYRTGSRSAGEFDLDRQVEGQIFRLGMLLEDIQEEINKNTESLFPSRSSPTSPTATNISHQTATEDAYSLLDVQKKVGACLQKETNNLRSCMGSLNRTTDPERQLCEQDTADVAKTAEYYNLVKTSTPSHFYPGAHHRIRRSEVSTQTMDLELKDQHTLLTSYEMMRRNTPSTLEFSASQNKGTNSFQLSRHILPDQYFRKKCFSDFCFTEKTHNAKETFLQKHGVKSREENERSPGFLNRYQTFESEKKELSNNTRLSIFIQENSLNLDFPDCNRIEGSLSCDSSGSTFSEQRTQSYPAGRNGLSNGQSYMLMDGTQLERYNDPVSCISHRRYLMTSSPKPSLEIDTTKRSFSGCYTRLPNPDTHIKGLYQTKSFWSSKTPVYAQSKDRMLNERHPSKHKTISRYPPTNRHKFQVPVSKHSVLDSPVVPSSQQIFQGRKSWSYVKQKSTDNMNSKTLNLILDQAIWTARSMQRTTERMMKKLTTDPVILPLHRRSYS